MNRIEIPLAQVRNKISEFYNPSKHHFIVMNGIDLGNKIEIQWFFVNYLPPGEMTTFISFALYDETIPSIQDLVPSAWVTEAEFYDLFDLKVENAKKGFVLETDSTLAPLRKGSR